MEQQSALRSRLIRASGSLRCHVGPSSQHADRSALAAGPVAVISGSDVGSMGRCGLRRPRSTTACRRHRRR